MDTIAPEMAQRAENYAVVAKPVVTESKPASKHAILEEIYDKLFEPSFQEFQMKQRPCHRYNGTYLEQIHEGQHAPYTRKGLVRKQNKIFFVEILRRFYFDKSIGGFLLPGLNIGFVAFACDTKKYVSK